MTTRAPKKKAPKNNAVQKTSPDPIAYDPLNPELSVVHRAGIAGLLLQIRTMRKLNEEMSEVEQENYSIPECEPVHDGRGIRIKFTQESFYSLMRELYRGDLVRRIVGKASHERRQKKLQQANQRYVYESPLANDKFAYLEPRPLLKHFEIFKAHEAWQEHTRNAMWNSYYCIPRSQLVFQLPSESGKNNKIDELWKALISEKRISLKKQYYPSSFGVNLKGAEVSETGESALLLLFWPLVALHFIPISLKAEKDKISGQATLRNVWQSPVIVVPDVTDVETFVEDFIVYLGSLGDDPSTRIYEDGRYIATPLEAPLAFFTAPRLAREVRNKIGTRGAEVYVFRQRPKIDKQPLVAAIVNESFEPRLVNEYERLMQKKIQSLPFRAICVDNLLAQPKRELYEGFERLVDQYPLELFVATKPKDAGARRFNRHGYHMARSLMDEFRSIEEKEYRMMNSAEPTIPFLIWRITRNYVRWRACGKADPPIDDGKLNALFAKKRNKQSLTGDEEKVLKRYNKTVGDVVERLFIDFRGYREMESFANAFTETLFRAPQNLRPELAEKLQPFIDSKEEWEGGRRLVLMAISAAGANASAAGSGEDSGENPESDSEEAEKTT